MSGPLDLLSLFFSPVPFLYVLWFVVFFIKLIPFDFCLLGVLKVSGPLRAFLIFHYRNEHSSFAIISRDDAFFVFTIEMNTKNLWLLLSLGMVHRGKSGVCVQSVIQNPKCPEFHKGSFLLALYGHIV
jgi:hypothetical protein